MLAFLLFFSGFRLTFLSKGLPCVFHFSGILFCTSIYTSNLVMDYIPVIPLISNFAFLIHGALLYSTSFIAMGIGMLFYLCQNHILKERQVTPARIIAMIVITLGCIIYLGEFFFDEAFRATNDVAKFYAPHFYKTVYEDEFQLGENLFVKQFIPQLLTLFHLSDN